MEHSPVRLAHCYGRAKLLRSMTGYGMGTHTCDARSVKVEVRTVNHRFLDVSIRLPTGYLALEDRLRALVAAKLSRGRVEMFVAVEEMAAEGRSVTLDVGLLRGYVAALAEAERYAPVEGRLSPSTLLSVPELFRTTEVAIDAQGAADGVLAATTAALSRLLHTREVEGQRLGLDISQRIEEFSLHIAAIAERAPGVVKAYRERMAHQLAEWGVAAVLDTDRIATEVALFADRANIDEEVVRARSHIEGFRAACAEGAGVGRKLDFIVQEMHREVNTIGSKANDAVISRHVVDAKACLEKIREQVQNVE